MAKIGFDTLFDLVLQSLIVDEAASIENIEGRGAEDLLDQLLNLVELGLFVLSEKQLLVLLNSEVCRPAQSY